MRDILGGLINKIKHILLRIMNYMPSSDQVEHIVQDDILYAFGFPDASFSLLSKLSEKKRITFVSDKTELPNNAESIVFYKATKEDNLGFKSTLSVSDLFGIGKEGAEFHRNLYILMTLNEYCVDELFISYFKAKKFNLLLDITNNFILEHKQNHNLYNIKALLLQKADNFHELLELALSASNELQLKKLFFIEKIVNENITHKLNQNKLLDKSIKKLLFNTASSSYNIKYKMPFNFVKFPASLHSLIRYIFPYLNISFIDEYNSADDVFYTSRDAKIANHTFIESLNFLDLGGNEKILHHNLYIANVLLRLEYNSELNDFIFNHEDASVLKAITTKLQTDTKKDISCINISCLLYARLTNSNLFFKQVAKLSAKDNLSLIISLMKDSLTFTEDDLSPIKDVVLLKTLALRLYKDMYYVEALEVLNRLSSLGDETYLAYLGLTLYKLNRFIEAERVLKKLLNRDDTNYAHWSYIGMVNMQQLKYEQAIQAYQKVLKLYPLKRDVNVIKSIANYHQIIANAGVRCDKKKFSLYHYFISVLYWPSNYNIYTVLYSESRPLYYLSKAWLQLVNQYLVLTIKLYSSDVSNKKHYVVQNILQSKLISLANSLIAKVCDYENIDLHKYLELIFNGNITFLNKQQQLLQNTIGRIYILEGDYEQGLHNLIKSTEASKTTEFTEPYIWLANFYLLSQQYHLAIEQYQNILDIRKTDEKAIAGTASCYVEQGLYKEASQYINENSGFFNQRKYSELTRVTKQNLAFGTKSYQLAWSYYKEILLSRTLKSDSAVHYVQSLSDIDPSDKVLLVGLWGPGDEVRWASLYHKFSSSFPNLTISCEPRLQSLMSRSFPKINFLSSARTIRGKYDNHKSSLYDKVPSVALISAFDNDLYSFSMTQDKVILVTDILEEMLSSESSFLIDEGYLIPDMNLLSYWKSKLNQIGNKPKIGVCWKSGLIDLSRSIHYTEIEEWLPLFSNENFTFVNLQYAGYEEDIRLLKKEHGMELVHFDELDLRDDFEGTAALMSNLDYIVSPCTTVAELSGALGVPTLLTSNAPDIVSRIKSASKQDLWFKSIHHIQATELGDKKSIINQVVEFLSDEFSDW